MKPIVQKKHISKGQIILGYCVFFFSILWTLRKKYSIRRNNNILCICTKQWSKQYVCLKLYFATNIINNYGWITFKHEAIAAKLVLVSEAHSKDNLINLTQHIKTIH